MEDLTPETGTLLKADQLFDMTITKEEKFESDRQSVLENLMTSMVQVATINGATEYAAALNPQFDKSLLELISNDLNSLGYTTSTTEKTDPNVGTFSNLSISWAKTDEGSITLDTSDESEIN